MQVAIDLQPANRAREPGGSCYERAPDAPCFDTAVARGQIGKILVGLLHQQCGARGGAAAPASPGLDNRHANARLAEEIGRYGASDPAADDDHIDAECSLVRGISAMTARRRAAEPDRSPVAKTH